MTANDPINHTPVMADTGTFEAFWERMWHESEMERIREMDIEAWVQEQV